MTGQRIEIIPLEPKSRGLRYPPADSEWKSWPGFSKYEASHRGPVRNLAGKVMADYPDKDGYRRLTLVNDDGKKVNVSRARCVLAAHAGPCPPGMETCHGPGGRADDRFPENIRWDTKEANNGADKAAAGTLPTPNPTYPCRDGCGNLVIHENRRCMECVPRAGREIAAQLARGVNLHDVAAAYGYTGPDWAYRLAVEYGGCMLTKREALTQHPSLSQRVTATVGDRFRRARLVVTHRDG